MIEDKHFKVVLISSYDRPNLIVYKALRQCYSSKPVYNIDIPEDKAGKIAVKRLLEGNRGHWGCLEHPQFTFNVCSYPHDTAMQARTHRVGISFDIQSWRYTGKHLLNCNRENIEEFFYVPATGKYNDREGKSVYYNEEMRNRDLEMIWNTVEHYQGCIEQGVPEEMIRRIISAGYRQHFVVSFNARSLLHFTDVRFKSNAQSEIQDLAERLFNIFSNYMPEIAEWYVKHRMGKAILSP